MFRHQIKQWGKKISVKTPQKGLAIIVKATLINAALPVMTSDSIVYFKVLCETVTQIKPNIKLLRI
jgi:hypothetical protein